MFCIENPAFLNLIIRMAQRDHKENQKGSQSLATRKKEHFLRETLCNLCGLFETNPKTNSTSFQFYSFYIIFTHHKYVR
jgi:CRP-like cAMP-binding protein